MKSRPATTGRDRSLFIKIVISAWAIALLTLLTPEKGRAEKPSRIVEQANSKSQEHDREGRFGVIESFESPDDADVLNVGWTRIIFQWSEVQAEGPDSWTPDLTDEQIEADIKAGRQVVGLLIGIPEWARDEDRLPRGLWLAHDDPENSWANFVRQAVTRYEGRISHWIIWNEPDIRETEIAHTWDGSVADFAQLQRVAYLTAKESNPEVIIHLAAFTYWADYYGGTEQYMARLLDEIMTDPQAAENNSYFDVATAHLYFQPSQIHDLLDLFVGIMRQRGLDQPIWLVETNAPPRDDPQWPVPDWFLSVTLEEQAAFIPQALASAMAAGAERIAVYKLRDNEDDRFANPEPFGLVRMDGSRRPAFESYRQAVSLLSGMTSAERERWDAVGQIRIDQAGRSTTVAFSRLPRSQLVQVKATSGSAQLVDMWGSAEEIAPVDGYFRLEVPAAPCSQSIGDYCMIGGSPYYLVQEKEASPPTTPSPTSPAAATASPTSIPSRTAPAITEATATPSRTPAAVSDPTDAPPLKTDAPTAVVTALPSPASTEIKEGTPVPLSPPLDSPLAPGIWFIGGGILVAGLLIAYWIVNHRK